MSLLEDHSWEQNFLFNLHTIFFFLSFFSPCMCLFPITIFSIRATWISSNCLHFSLKLYLFLCQSRWASAQTAGQFSQSRFFAVLPSIISITEQPYIITQAKYILRFYFICPNLLFTIGLWHSSTIFVSLPSLINPESNFSCFLDAVDMIRIYSPCRGGDNIPHTAKAWRWN